MAIKKPFKGVNQWNVKGISKWVDEVTEAVNAQEKQLNELKSGLETAYHLISKIKTNYGPQLAELDIVANGNCESIDKQAVRIDEFERIVNAWRTEVKKQLDELDDSAYCHDNRINALEKLPNPDDLIESLIQQQNEHSRQLAKLRQDVEANTTEDGHTDEQPDDDWHCPHCWSTKGTWFDRTI